MVIAIFKLSFITNCVYNIGDLLFLHVLLLPGSDDLHVWIWDTSLSCILSLFPLSFIFKLLKKPPCFL